MILDQFRTEALFRKLFGLAKTCKIPKDKARYMALEEKFCKQPFTGAEYAVVCTDLTKVNQELQMFRLRNFSYHNLAENEEMAAIAETLSGDTLVHSIDIKMDCTANSPGYASFLRCIPTLKSLRKLTLQAAPFSQPLFAAIFISGIQKLHIGRKKDFLELPTVYYDNLCLFLQSYPNLIELTAYIHQRGDPGLSKLFISLKDNPLMKLTVRIHF